MPRAIIKTMTPITIPTISPVFELSSGIGGTGGTGGIGSNLQILSFYSFSMQI
jgi:hypothetical protein